MTILALIPARGGSKRIPGKNIKHLGDHPLIAYSIAAALQAETVDRTIVTTDAPDIARISRDYGAETPFLRPDAIAQDMSTDWEAFQHALQWLDENEGYRPDLIIHLRPTVPLRPPGLIDQAVQTLLQAPSADSVRSLIPFEPTPYKMWRMAADGFIKPVAEIPGLPEAYNMPGQKLPQAYLHSGHVDVIRWSVVMEKRSMTGQNIMPILVDPVYTGDIDTPDDWSQTEQRLNYLQRPYTQPIARS